MGSVVCLFENLSGIESKSNQKGLKVVLLFF